MAASGIVLCFATLAGFGVFSSGKGAVPNCFDTDEADHARFRPRHRP